MKQVVPPIKSVAAICGIQKPEQSTAYRLNRHCITVPCREGTLLYHTLTGALLLTPSGSNAEEEKRKLTEQWYLVPGNFDETGFADDVRRIAGMMKPSNGIKTDFTVLTTTDCNARCFYCYEMGIRRVSMSRATAAETAEYIIKACQGKPVRIRWFGGEPLYNREAIDIICNRLSGNGNAFESSMVTNGYYLDEKTIEVAYKAWHLQKVQITIDGTEEMYNRTKAYIDADENPYARVMNNIRHAVEAGIRVTIRLNMDARNAGDLLELIDDVAERFQGSNRPDMYVELLHAFAGNIHKHQSQEQAEQDYIAIEQKLNECGLMKRRKIPRSICICQCMADNDLCEVILPDGRTGRCEHFSEAMITGDIFSETRNPDVEKKWKARLIVPECADCPLYPQCTKLRECEWNRNGCPEIERRIRTKEIKKLILSAYEEYRNGDEKK